MYSYIYNDLESFQNGVDTIVDGCTTYGSTPTASTPSSIITAISNIYTNRYNTGVTDTKKGNATAAQVLSGKTFTNASSVNISGTMTNNGAVSKTFTPRASSQTYTIPKGYHNGSGKVTVNAASLQPTSVKTVFTSSTATWDGSATKSGFVVGKITIITAYMISTGSDRYIKISSGMTLLKSNCTFHGDYRQYIFIGIATSTSITLSMYGQNMIEFGCYLA